MDTEAVSALNSFGTQSGLQQLISEYTWLAIIAFVLLLFKSQLEGTIAGLQTFLGSQLNESDVIILNGRSGRVVKVGMSRTVFYLYNYNAEGQISGGTQLTVPNTSLATMMIEKPLSKLELEDLPIKKNS